MHAALDLRLRPVDVDPWLGRSEAGSESSVMRQVAHSADACWVARATRPHIREDIGGMCDALEMDTVRDFYAGLYCAAAFLPLCGLIVAVVRSNAELQARRRSEGLTLGDLSDHFGSNPAHMVMNRRWQVLALVLVGVGLVCGSWASIGSLYI